MPLLIHLHHKFGNTRWRKNNKTLIKHDRMISIIKILCIIIIKRKKKYKPINLLTINVIHHTPYTIIFNTIIVWGRSVYIQLINLDIFGNIAVYTIFTRLLPRAKAVVKLMKEILDVSYQMLIICAFFQECSSSDQLLNSSLMLDNLKNVSGYLR